MRKYVPALGILFPSTCRHADLIVDSDVLKTSLKVKMIQVSIMRFTICITMQPLYHFPYCTSRTRPQAHYLLIYSPGAQGRLLRRGGLPRWHRPAQGASCSTSRTCRVHIVAESICECIEPNQQVLAFTTRVHNIGCAPFLVGVPNGSTPGYAHGTFTACA